MISIQQIQYILALNDFGQFQKASEACYVTQPTLSMQVKKAEDQLGHLIFDRSKNPVALTSFGETLIPILKDVQNENSRIAYLVKKESGLSGRITVGVIPTIAVYLLPSLMEDLNAGAFSDQFLFKEMQTQVLLDKLLAKEIDLAILAGPFVNAGYQTSKLYEEEIKCFLGHNEFNVINSKVLEKEKPWLLSEGNCLRSQMVSFCNVIPEGQHMNWDYEGGNLQMLVRMVTQNRGYTLVPAYYAEQETLHTASVRIEGNDHFPGRSVIAVYSGRSIYRSAIEKLLRTIQHRFMSRNTAVLNIIGWQGG